MERRIGTLTIIVYNLEVVPKVQHILSQFSEIIVARQGLNFRTENLHIITVILDGQQDQFNALAGKLGKLQGIDVRSHSISIKNQEP